MSVSDMSSIESWTLLVGEQFQDMIRQFYICVLVFSEGGQTSGK